MSSILERVKIGDNVELNVSYVHPEYIRMLPKWEKYRDATEGEEAIKAKGTQYLPRLNGQTAEEYQNYLERAQWYGATGRTNEAYLGMLFRKPPVLNYALPNNEEISSQLHDDLGVFFNNITHDGKSCGELLKTLLGEIITVNKVGLLVDFPKVYNDRPLSQYEYERLNLKPLASVYKAESIINWHCEIINNEVVPIFFVLREQTYRIASEDMFAPMPEYLYRILYLEGFNTPNRRYKQIEISTKTISDPTGKEKSAYEVQNVIYPKNKGKYLDFIPFYVLTNSGIDYRYNGVSMISDLVNTNVGHYRNSADWENELHWVAIKTIYFPGWNSRKYGQPRVGGALAGPKDSKPEMIEASSDSAIKDEMKLKEERMAVLGAERISQKGRYIPSAETAKINSTAESSVLSGLSDSISEACTKIFTFMLDWSSKYAQKINVVCNVNNDFYEDDISGEELLKWIQAYQSGGISYDTFYYNLEKKEAFPINWGKGKELEAIERTSNTMFTLSDEKYTSLSNEISKLKNILNIKDSDDVLEEEEE